MTTKHAVHFTSARTQTGRDDWGTPQGLFDRLNQEFRFVLDAAASHENALCPRYFTPEGLFKRSPVHGPRQMRDGCGLTGDWHAVAPSVFLNPPYSMLREFLTKAREEAEKGVTVAVLVPARTDTRAFHENIWAADEVRLIQGRLTFTGAPAPAPFPSAIIVFGTKRQKPRFSPLVLTPEERGGRGS